MKPSSHQQPFTEVGREPCDPTEQEADVGLSFNLACCSINVFIEATEKRHIVVTCATSTASGKSGSIQPAISDAQAELFPVKLLLSPETLVAMLRILAWQSTSESASVTELVETNPNLMTIRNQQRDDADKIQHRMDADAPIYSAKCQGTHDGPCHGELWICSGCSSRICEVEHTDTEPRLCYRCWDKQYTLAMMPDAQERVSPTSETIVIGCDCSENGGDCGTWLELTPDGILAVEDKDGLRVSIMLPQWLDEAIRKTVALQPMVAPM